MTSLSAIGDGLAGGDERGFRVVRGILIGLGLCCLTFFAMLQLTWPQQTVVGVVMLFLAFWLTRVSNSYLITLTLMVMSLFATVRYACWRIGTVANFFLDPGNKWGPLDAFFILLLVAAETYAFIVLFLGFMQTIWPLRRAPVPLPENPEEWPHVDLLIPTYNEPMSIVRYTALASLNIDWPADKLHVYILDDGKREEFRKFAEEAGVGYMTRSDNKHAKAGNINRALQRLTSPYVAIFDCDHVPTRSFMQMTIGWFLRDRNLGMLQTPHHFYSPDPFERNLNQFRIIPNEGELFYGIVQDGNDFWNATFFCGSCAVLRRTALDEIGGIAVETVTEDAHTSLRMQMNKWNTAYINIPQAAGLATERLSGHVKQRIRWARGMVQILRTDNPLTARGLKLAQRLCYFNAMTHFMYALPRLIFLTSPLIYLLLSQTNVPGYWAAIFAYALPHLILSNLTNSRIQGLHRHSFWNEIYETVLSPYILMPTLLALVNPKLGKFDVTAKGGVVNRTYFDKAIAQPFIVMLLFNVLGLLMVIPRSIHIPLPLLNRVWDGDHPGTIAMNAIWTVFNIVILGVSTAVAQEMIQQRQQVRIHLVAPVKLKLADGRVLHTQTADISTGGVSLSLEESEQMVLGDLLQVVFALHVDDAELPARLVARDGKTLHLQFEPLTLVEEEMLTMVLYSRADRWLAWGDHRESDRPMESLKRIFELSVVGLKIAFRSLILRKKPDGARRGVAVGSVSSILLTMLLALPFTAHAAQATAKKVTATATKAETPAPSSNSFQTTLTLKDLGLSSPIELRGFDGMGNVFFSLPNEQVVKQASLHLVYHFSPGLLTQLSHIKVALNGTLVATLLPPATTTGNEAILDRDISLPADLLVRKNELSFEFIGHYTMQCEDPANSVLWSRIDPSTSVSLSGDLLPIADDLKFLPLPFFDEALTRKPVIPISFSGQPSQIALQAAGAVTSYFGILTDYRAARFPVSVGTIPQGNVVLIAENPATLPASLQLGPISAPTLAIRTNPDDPHGKVLVVTGADGEQLLTAAQALAMNWNGIQGATATVQDFTLPAPREADTAPRWMETNKRIPLWDYSAIESLQTDGSVPVQTFFRLPPDLYYADKQDVLLHLNYRYNPLPIGPSSSMQVRVNGGYIGSVPLTPSKGSSRETAADVGVPVVNIRPFSNSLNVGFAFQVLKKGQCLDTTPINLQGSVLRSSYLDLRQFPHWAAMPNLELFSNAGFPFTRFADLSQTTVVMPEAPTSQEVELYLTMMAHFGAETGFPVLRVTVADAGAMHAGEDRDFLVIGTAQDNSGISKAADNMPVQILSDGGLKAQDTEGFFAPFRRAWWKIRTRDQQVSGDFSVNVSPDAILEGLESPYSSNRSLVIVRLKDAGSYEPFTVAFLKAAQSSDISGTVSVLHGTEFQSFRLGNNVYHVGRLPLWMAVNLWFTRAPWMIAIGVLAIAAVFAVWIRAWLRKRARQRLRAVEE
ncbi:UDP-forming cellulose synthase catalytic subunit [Silvibacterium acidisoli]|uniref:UDP-forming cellulose synthase catalytic subunit n=1 Tax=Acidobacteriaceae bacterium ZG23-2 TaxID=2883246 RepID=UPI00406C4CF6